jgi:hypothetical protein
MRDVMATPAETKPTLLRKADPPPVQPPPPKLPARLRDQDIGVLESKQGSWHARMRPEHTLSDLLKPEYLSHRCHGMRARDRVQYDHPDWTLDALIVRVDQEMKLVWVVPLPGYPLDLKSAQLASADMSLAVTEETADGTWRIRIGHEVAVSGLASEAAAEKWLADRKLRGIA